MRRPAALFTLLAAAVCASAQVTLSTVQGGVVTPVQAYDFGAVGLGSVSNVDFRLTNTGSTGVYLTSLGISGLYALDFSMVCPLSPDLCGGTPFPETGTILIGPNTVVTQFGAGSVESNGSQ